MRQVLVWAMGHDPATAARLAGALGWWWWWLRGRLPGQYGLPGMTHRDERNVR